MPAVRRVIEIAYNKGLIQTDLPIDQLLFRVKVKSPLALAREAQRIEKIVQWLQMVIATLTSIGQAAGTKRIAHIELMLTELGRDMGVPGRMIVTDDERKQIDEDDRKQALALAAATALAQGAGAAAGAGDGAAAQAAGTA